MSTYSWNLLKDLRKTRAFGVASAEDEPMHSWRQITNKTN